MLFRRVPNRFWPIFLSFTFTVLPFHINALPSDLYDTNDTNDNALSPRLSTVTTTSATSASRAPCPAGATEPLLLCVCDSEVIAFTPVSFLERAPHGPHGPWHTSDKGHTHFDVGSTITCDADRGSYRSLHVWSATDIFLLRLLASPHSRCCSFAISDDWVVSVYARGWHQQEKLRSAAAGRGASKANELRVLVQWWLHMPATLPGPPSANKLDCWHDPHALLILLAVHVCQASLAVVEEL